jgi:hypothetical protein
LCAGITRERLEGFDRPIKVEPEDYPDKREALIKEFRNYLGILKARLLCSPPLIPGLFLQSAAQCTASDRLLGLHFAFAGRFRESYNALRHVMMR